MERLTDEQRGFWEALDMGMPRISGDQTEEQARNMFVASFRAACQFEGVPVPTDEAIFNELDGPPPAYAS